MQEDKIISALIGLVGACGNNPKTENTDHIIVKALALPPGCQDTDDTAIREMAEEIHAEKNIIAPSCAFCAMPCGNTSDYDMNKIYTAPENIRDAKLRIIAELRKSAAMLSRSGKERNPDTDCDIFYKALSYIAYNTNPDELLLVLTEVQEQNKNYSL